jgi:hypothetical protein
MLIARPGMSPDANEGDQDGSFAKSQAART